MEFQYQVRDISSWKFDLFMVLDPEAGMLLYVRLGRIYSPKTVRPRRARFLDHVIEILREERSKIGTILYLEIIFL